MVFPVRKVLESVHGLQRITMQRFQSSSLVIYENTQLISYYSPHETFLPSFRFTGHRDSIRNPRSDDISRKKMPIKSA